MLHEWYTGKVTKIKPSKKINTVQLRTVKFLKDGQQTLRNLCENNQDNVIIERLFGVIVPVSSLFFTFEASTFDAVDVSGKRFTNAFEEEVGFDSLSPRPTKRPKERPRGCRPEWRRQLPLPL